MTDNNHQIMRAVRRNPRKPDRPKWNVCDQEELVQMFRAAMTWDGNHCSKDGRDHLLEHGYAYRVEGQTALTGKGKIAALLCWPMPLVWYREWRRGKLNGFERHADQKSATR